MGGEPRDPERVLRDPGRLAALRSAGLLDTEPEEAFDRLTRLAARLLGVPVSLVSLVDERRHFFKSQVGLAEPWASARATPLSHSFCRHAVVAAEPLVIEDARVDERVRDSPAGEALGLVAYLGVPLLTSDGHALGAFCACDRVPRRWSADDVAALRDLAAAATEAIELRRRAAAEHRARERLERLHRATAELSNVRTPAETTRAIVEQAVAALEADGGSVLLLDGGELAYAAALGLASDAMGHGVRLPVPGRSAAAAAVAAGHAVLVETRARLVERFPETAALFAGRVGSLAAFPLVSGDRPLGVLGLLFADERALTPDDLDMGQTLAEQCAQALERSRLQLEAERSAAASEARYAAIVEHAPEAIVVLDVEEHRFTAVNARAEQLFGMTREALLTVGPAEVSPPEQPGGRPSAEAAMEWIGRALRGETPSFEWTHCRGDGTPVACEVRLLRLPDPERLLVRGSVVEVEERNAAERALREAEAQRAARETAEALSEELRRERDLQAAFLASLQDGFFAFDPAGKVTTANARFAQLTGFPLERLVGSTPPYPWWPDDGEARAAVERADAALREQGAGEFELTYRRADGSAAHVILSAAAVRDPEDGSVAAFVATVKDTTRLTHLAAQHRDVLERLRTVVDASPLAILTLDLEGRVVSWSAAAERIFGWSEEEARGRIPPFVPDNRLDEYRERIAAVLAAEAARDFEARRLRKDGTPIDLRINSARIVDEHGTPTGIVALVADVTAEKRAAADLRATHDSLALALRASTAGAWQWDVESDRITATPEWFDLFGLSPDEASGAAWRGRLHPQDRPAVTVRIGELLEHGGEWNVEFRIVHPERGVRWLAGFGRLEVGPDGSAIGVQGINIDITDRKQTELERDALLEREQSARRSAERAAARIAALQDVTEALSAARSAADVLDAVFRKGLSALGAAAGRIGVVAEDGMFDVYALGLAPGGKVFERETLDEPLPGAASVRDGVPRWFRSREELLAAFPAAPAILHGAELEAAATVPFPSGAVRGFLSPHWAEIRAFSSDDRALLTTLARLCAQALERARAYDEEHRVAETLQRSLLPKRIPPVAGVAIGVRYVPAGPGLDVGGDWYDVLETADGHLLAVVGDVVGHGLEAAASMGQIRNALRAYALEGLGPGDAVARTSALVQAVGQGEMTTAAVVRFDPATRSLRYTCAGHPPPLVISPDGEVVRLEGGRTLPLGVAPLVPDEASATVPDGATLLLYTDGLVERRGSSLDAGIARLSETAAAAAAGDVDALLDRVLALAGESRSDDVALLALRPLPVANEPLALLLPADPASLVHLRRSLRAYLERAGLGPEETYDVVLACSEAAANAIEHGTAPPAAEFAVRAEIVGGELRVAVTDSGRWRPPRERGRGRGLPLMRALMETVDVETGAGGTEVRMRRRLSAGAPA